MKLQDLPLTAVCPYTDPRRTLLRDAMIPFVAELRFIDMDDLVDNIARQQYANLDDLIQSSLELLFLPGVLAFGWSANLIAGWDEPFQIALDMEFMTNGVTVFFALRIGRQHHDVDLQCITFAREGRNPHENTASLAEALRLARRASTDQSQGSDKALRPR